MDLGVSSTLFPQELTLVQDLESSEASSLRDDWTEHGSAHVIVGQK